MKTCSRKRRYSRKNFIFDKVSYSYHALLLKKINSKGIFEGVFKTVKNTPRAFPTAAAALMNEIYWTVIIV